MSLLTMETWIVPAVALAGALAAGALVVAAAVVPTMRLPEQAAAIGSMMAIGAASRSHRALLDCSTGSSSSAMWTPRRVQYASWRTA
jgi:hypothetical protein